MSLHRFSVYSLKFILLFLLYYSTAKLGLQLDAVSGFATLFWLPTGISLAAILILGYKYFPAIALAAFLSNLTTNASVPAALGIMTGNTLEAVVGAYLLRRVWHFNRTLEHTKDVFGLIIIAAFLSTLISATIGASSLYLAGQLSSPFIMTWVSWWVGDMLSNLIVAPFLLVWTRPFSVPKRGVFEAALLSIMIIISGLFVFVRFFNVAAFPYMLFPVLIWASIRFGLRGSTSAIFALSLIAVWSTSQGFGPFARDTISLSLLLLQTFMGITSITFLILASLSAEKKSLEARKDDFIGFASHELKTPLTSIKLFVDALTKNSTNIGKKEANYLLKIDKQLDRLNSLINDLLDLSRIQTGKMELRKDWFSLSELIEDMASTMRSLSKKPIIIKGNHRKKVFADKDRIEQVILNLLTNAIKYSPDGKKITIAIKSKKDNVIVSIKDQGIGIPPAQQAKIFERFYRVNDLSAQSGMGIGLYLTKMIVKKHKGDIWVESKEGKGSTFSFSLRNKAN